MTLNPAANATSGNFAPSQTAETCAPAPAHRAQGQGRFSQYHASQQSPAWSGIDWCAPEHAHVLANRIKAFWAKRGKTVNVEIMAGRASKGSNLHHFAIRSNMVGGRPK